MTEFPHSRFKHILKALVLYLSIFIFANLYVHFATSWRQKFIFLFHNIHLLKTGTKQKTRIITSQVAVDINVCPDHRLYEKQLLPLYKIKLKYLGYGCCCLVLLTSFATRQRSHDITFSPIHLPAQCQS